MARESQEELLEWAAAEGAAADRERLASLAAQPVDELVRCDLEKLLADMPKSSQQEFLRLLADRAKAEGLSEVVTAALDNAMKQFEEMTRRVARLAQAGPGYDVPVPAAPLGNRRVMIVAWFIAGLALGGACALVGIPHLQMRGWLPQPGISAAERADLRWASRFGSAAARKRAAWAETDMGRWARRFADRNAFLRGDCPSPNHDLETGKLTCSGTFWYVK